MKDRIKENKWLVAYIVLNIICVIYGSLYAQHQNDWDATEILYEMDRSWSVGNGCLEGNHKVVNVYDGLELNGNILEVMDARIQVIGRLTNFGEDISVDNELIIYSCTSSELVVYSDILTVEDVVDDFEVRLYPNPTYEYINIDTDTLDSYTIYDIKGKLIQKGIDKTVNVYNFQSGMYFIILRYKDRFKTIRFIKM